MENKELNQDKKDKIIKALKTSAFKQFKIMSKYFLIVLGLNLGVSLLDFFYVHSHTFVLLCGVANAIFMLVLMRPETLQEEERVKAEIRKIVEGNDSNEHTNA